MRCMRKPNSLMLMVVALVLACAAGLAQATALRASRLLPSLTAMGRYLVMRRMLSRAKRSLAGWATLAM